METSTPREASPKILVEVDVTASAAGPAAPVVRAVVNEAPPEPLGGEEFLPGTYDVERTDVYYAPGLDPELVLDCERGYDYISTFTADADSLIVVEGTAYLSTGPAYCSRVSRYRRR